MGKKLRQTTVARGVCKSGESARLDQRKLQALKFLQLILILYLSSVLYLFIYLLHKKKKPEIHTDNTFWKRDIQLSTKEGWMKKFTCGTEGWKSLSNRLKVVSNTSNTAESKAPRAPKRALLAS